MFCKEVIIRTLMHTLVGNDVANSCSNIPFCNGEFYLHVCMYSCIHVFMHCILLVLLWISTVVQCLGNYILC